MSDDDLTAATNRLLAGFDFAGAAAAAEEAHRAETERLLRGFLEVVDSLDAFVALDGDVAAARAKTIQRIHAQALRVLESAGVSSFPAAGKPVDLTSSEVVEVRADPAVPEDTVIEEVVRGYLWRGRLLRRARVVIAREDNGKGEQR